MEADGRVFHNAGATEAQELGAMLASAAAHLRLFEDARQALVYAAPHIGFAVSVDQDQFLSMAKVRALRKLWARMLEVCSIPSSVAAIHAETSWRMMTATDPETNILRSTIACFAAATGGADSVSVLPHTIAHGLPEGFARRIARNAQLVMAAESHLDFVADPASGSGGIEALTDALCEKAWDEFRQIETEGGILRSLAEGICRAASQPLAMNAPGNTARARGRSSARPSTGSTRRSRPARSPRKNGLYRPAARSSASDSIHCAWTN